MKDRHFDRTMPIDGTDGATVSAMDISANDFATVDHIAASSKVNTDRMDMNSEA